MNTQYDNHSEMNSKKQNPLLSMRYSMKKLFEKLKRIFNLKESNPKQALSIERLVEGRSSVFGLPTSDSRLRTSDFGPRTSNKHRTIALFFIAIFLQTLVPYNQLWANSNGPIAPEAASFEPVDATDMVSLLSGDFTYVMPLIDVPSPEGGYPLALSYHAGIAVDQEASWVGLGWSLNPGAINRTVAGVPDDWETTKKYSVLYDAGGIQRQISGGVSVGWGDGVASAGLYASYTENKTASGERSYRFDAGITGSVGVKGTGFGVSGRLGTDGIGIGATYNAGRPTDTAMEHSTFGASLNQSFIDGTTSLGGQVSGISMGVSLSSRNGLRGNIANVPIGSTGSNTLSSQVSVVSTGWTAVLPIPLGASGATLNINASYKKTKYWVYENDYSVFDGALYAGNLSNSMKENLFSFKNAFDSYESFYTTERKEEMQRANYTAIAYDGYSVSGQGISGSIKPYIFEEAILRNQTRVIDTDSDGQAQITAAYNYPRTDNPKKFSKSFNDIYFYFENEYSSFLKVKSGNWSYTPNGSYSSLYDLNTSNPSFETTLQKDGKTYNGYNQFNKRLRKGSFIETFTNQQILNNPIGFIKPTDFDRTRSSIPLDGIGAYRITTTDGKVYHYSLPVYQYEKFSRATGINENINFKYFEEVQLEPYATHWLLTAVTGPDYVDMNNNGKVDEGDYGYWVDFEYGLWSEGFGWRTPKTGTEQGEKSKIYEWGVKEVYYLDRIKTRTHTALFIKSEREDNESSGALISFGPKEFEDVHIKSYIRGDDGDWYFNGVYDDIPKNDDAGIVYSWHTFYSKIHLQKSLKLDKIVLVKNSNQFANVDKRSSDSQDFIKGGTIKIDERFEQHSLFYGKLSDHWRPIHNRSWNAHLINNVLDSGDLPQSNEGALKVVQFATDYSLAKTTLIDSKYPGRLTLKEVQFNGKNGKATMPGYSFSYLGENTIFDKDLKDDWGYNRKPSDWSMDKINTPIGSSINIEYERDDYRYEAAITSTSEENKRGGGIRVKSLAVQNNGKSYVTSYKYTIPNTNQTSGVTSFSPSKKEKEVKYISEIPGPGVMYEYVTVEQKYNTDQAKTKDVYHFKVMPKMTESNGGFQLGDIVQLSRKQNSNSTIKIGGTNLSANFTKFDLLDHKASLGNLISKTTYNSENQIIGLEENEYYSVDQIEQGVLQETNKMYKEVRNYSNYNYLMSSSSTKKIPSILKSRKVYGNGFDFITNYAKHDFLTGNVLETITNTSEGFELKTESIPAYHKYEEMDTKADNLRNKNMLLQGSASFISCKDSSDNWVLSDASIQTWKSWSDNDIWRKHKNYVWKGVLNEDGTYKDYIDFDWSANTAPNSGWQKVSETTKYDNYSKSLEALDINNNKIATKMGDNDTKVIATSNSGYNEMYYCGAEYIEGSHLYFEGGVLSATASGREANAHTGSYSVKIDGNKKSFEANVPADNTRSADNRSKFKVSVWVRKGDESRTKILLNTSKYSFNDSERVYAGDWVQLNGYITIPNNGATVAIACDSGTILADDFRLHPIASSMTSYVYNEWDELAYILGANNMATKYEYDAAGRLKATYVEAMDEGTSNPGGFRPANQIIYNYKK